MAKKAALIFCSLLSISACSNDPGFVSRTWSENIRELGIAPIFPPREDVHVGDIYLPPNPSIPNTEEIVPQNYSAIGIWLGQVQGIQDEISSFYRSRSEFPKSSTTISQVLSSTNSTHTMLEQTSSTTDIFKSGNTNRLRLVGFPEFLSASYSGSNIAAIIPAEAFSVGTGISLSKIEKATIKVPSAESYGLPAAKILKKLINGNTVIYNTGSQNCKEAQHLIPQGQRNPDGSLPEYFYLDVISEVFYARAIDIDINFSQGAASDIHASPGPMTAQAQKPLGMPNQTTSQLEINSNTQALSQSAASSLAALSSSGVTVNIVSSSSGGISLRRIYERPIAIGYRGFSLRVKAKDCTSSPDGAQGGISDTTPKSTKELSQQ